MVFCKVPLFADLKRFTDESIAEVEARVMRNSGNEAGFWFDGPIVARAAVAQTEVYAT
jgi:hypothetical protein